MRSTMKSKIEKNTKQTFGYINLLFVAICFVSPTICFLLYVAARIFSFRTSKYPKGTTLFIYNTLGYTSQYTPPPLPPTPLTPLPLYSINIFLLISLIPWLIFGLLSCFQLTPFCNFPLLPAPELLCSRIPPSSLLACFILNVVGDSVSLIVALLLLSILLSVPTPPPPRATKVRLFSSSSSSSPSSITPGGKAPKDIG